MIYFRLLFLRLSPVGPVNASFQLSSKLLFLANQVPVYSVGMLSLGCIMSYHDHFEIISSASNRSSQRTPYFSAINIFSSVSTLSQATTTLAKHVNHSCADSAWFIENNDNFESFYLYSRGVVCLLRGTKCKVLNIFL